MESPFKTHSARRDQKLQGSDHKFLKYRATQSISPPVVKRFTPVVKTFTTEVRSAT